MRYDYLVTCKEKNVFLRINLQWEIQKIFELEKKR